MTGVTREEAPVVVEGDGVEMRMREIGGDMTAAFLTFPRGTDMRPVLKGMPDDLCQCPHWGFLFKGRLRMHTKTGPEEYEAGQAFYWAPGHAPEALEDCEFLDISPTDKFNEVMDHVRATMG